MLISPRDGLECAGPGGRRTTGLKGKAGLAWGIDSAMGRSGKWSCCRRLLRWMQRQRTDLNTRFRRSLRVCVRGPSIVSCFQRALLSRQVLPYLQVMRSSHNCTSYSIIFVITLQFEAHMKWCSDTLCVESLLKGSILSAFMLVEKNQVKILCPSMEITIMPILF
jgi:hypothetical protein